MRIVSMEKGDNVKRIIERFAKATSTIQVRGYGQKELFFLIFSLKACNQ